MFFFVARPPDPPTPRNSNNPEMMESVSSGNQTRPTPTATSTSLFFKIHFQQRASAFPDPPQFHIVAIKRRNYYLRPVFFEGSEVKGQSVAELSVSLK